jgi:FkbM family methyltransferase
MIISLGEIKTNYGIDVRGIIHIGSHSGQEYEECAKHCKDMMFFEPVQSNYKLLIESLPKSDNIITFNLALGNEVGTKEMYIETANKGMSCSMLEPGTHLKLYPWITFDSREIVGINKLDNIFFDRKLYNIINIDVQGYELQVFMGARQTLDTIDVIFTEINTEDVYKGCAKVWEIDEYLGFIGFERVLSACDGAWGDALYIKK